MRHRTLLLLSSLVVAVSGSVGRAVAEVPRPVRVQTVTLVQADHALTYSGSVRAHVLADLAFRVGGKVIDRPVSIGDRVAAGQILARIDTADLNLALQADQQTLAAAVADARNAQAEFERYQHLGRVSPAFVASEFDRREAAMNMAIARRGQAQRQVSMAANALDYSTLRADADGLITALSAEVGQVVSAGQSVATLAHAAETEIVVDVPENSLPDIRAATAITVTLWSAPERLMHGRVREIGALADPVSRTFAVKITILDAPPDLLGLGMTATVRFARPGAAPVALLPATSLADQDGKPAVWVLDDRRHRASLRPVTIAAYAGDGDVAIAAGLAAGEQVVTAGIAELDPALPVTAWQGPVR